VTCARQRSNPGGRAQKGRERQGKERARTPCDRAFRRPRRFPGRRVGGSKDGKMTKEGRGGGKGGCAGALLSLCSTRRGPSGEKGPGERGKRRGKEYEQRALDHDEYDATSPARPCIFPSEVRLTEKKARRRKGRERKGKQTAHRPRRYRRCPHFEGKEGKLISEGGERGKKRKGGDLPALSSSLLFPPAVRGRG